MNKTESIQLVPAEKIAFSVTKRDILNVVLWPLIFLTSAISYIYALSQYEDISKFEQYSIAGTLPVIVLVLSLIMERVNPYKKTWNKFDMQTINNFLYQFITTYGEAAGKALALIVAPLIISWVSMEGYSIWPASIPFFLQVVIGLLLYDFIYYWYHRISHSTNWLWRIHRLHHSTEPLNVLCGFRFNMLDILIEFLVIVTIITIIGIPERVYFTMLGFMIPATVLSHANFEAKLPRFLDWIVISPSSHRIHHAKDDKFLNSNFGGFTLFWDVVFRTYKPSVGNNVAETGLSDHQTSRWIWFQQFDFLKK